MIVLKKRLHESEIVQTTRNWRTETVFGEVHVQLEVMCESGYGELAQGLRVFEVQNSLLGMKMSGKTWRV